jgi:hypothetical protein
VAAVERLTKKGESADFGKTLRPRVTVNAIARLSPALKKDLPSQPLTSAKRCASVDLGGDTQLRERPQWMDQSR